MLVIVELQITGYATSKIKYYFLDSNIVQPQINYNLTENKETTTLLAVGDIVKCDRDHSLTEFLPNTNYLLGIANNFRTEESRANKTARLAATWPDAPILALGDIVYRQGSPAEFRECFDPVWGSIKERILPTPGNHEYKTPGAFGYFDYFGNQAGSGQNGWYATTAPGWLILSLNSEVDATDGSAQSIWLDDQLSNSKNACILAFYHKPAHSLKPRRNTENAKALFTRLHEAGTTLVLNGHNHFYERTAPIDATGRTDLTGGAIAFTIGTGGRTEGALPNINETEVSIFERLGLLKLELKNNSFEWAYIDAETVEVLDQGARPCNSRKKL